MTPIFEADDGSADGPITRRSFHRLRASLESTQDDLGFEHEELILGKSSAAKPRGLLHIIAIAVSFGALQIVFAVLASYGSLHLISIGLSKFAVSIVWMAGPVAGTIVQPYCGIRSDRCTLSWGRRRPFIVGGSSGIISTLLGLAWAPDLVSKALHGNRLIGQVLAVVCMIALQVSVQPLQIGLRALMIDFYPPEQQNQAAAWVARMIGAGNIVGQLAGSANLPKMIPFFARTQFKDLSLLASFAVACAMFTTCSSSKEEDPKEFDLAPRHLNQRRRRGDLAEALDSVRRIPTAILDVWKIQFFSWMGWFPVMSYITTYVDEISLRKMQSHTEAGLTEQNTDESLRTGAQAMFLYATVSFVSSIILPHLVKASTSKSRTTIPSLTLTRLWALSQLLFGLTLLTTPLVATTLGRTTIASILGISWACTTWIPFVLISSRTSRDIVEARWTRDASARPGLVMSLHNVAIAGPQIVSALLSGAIFWTMGEDGKGTSLVLCMGGVCGLVAAFLAGRLGDGGPADGNGAGIEMDGE